MVGGGVSGGGVNGKKEVFLPVLVERAVVVFNVSNNKRPLFANGRNLQQQQRSQYLKQRAINNQETIKKQSTVKN